MGIVTPFYVKDGRSMEIKQVKKGIVIEDVDRYSMCHVDWCPWAIFTHNVINTREGNVPLLLGLVTYLTLAISSGGLKGRGRRREIRHANN